MSMPPPPMPAYQPPVAACTICGAQGTLVARQDNITTKKRPKFGIFWILVSILTGGIGFLLWLIWPRHKEVIGIDRYTECTACGSRV